MQNDEKIQKLREATKQAHDEMTMAEAKHKEATQNLQQEKDRLRKLDPSQQATTQVNDTKLPELLSLQTLAQDEYQVCKSRLEANQRYLNLFLEKQKQQDSA